jgi:hypothetical protein
MVAAGLAPTLTAPTADNDVVDIGRIFLMVTNAGDSAATVVVETPGTIDGLDIDDRTVSVASGATELIPLTSQVYRQTTASADLPGDVGRAYVDYTAGSGDTIADITRGVIGL